MGVFPLSQPRRSLYVHSHGYLCTRGYLPGAPVGDNRGVSGQKFVLSRWATVSVNGGPPVPLRQRSGNAGIILSQPLNVTFHEGGGNTITLAGLNGSACQTSFSVCQPNQVYLVQLLPPIWTRSSFMGTFMMISGNCSFTITAVDTEQTTIYLPRLVRIIHGQLLVPEAPAKHS